MSILLRSRRSPDRSDSARGPSLPPRSRRLDSASRWRATPRSRLSIRICCKVARRRRRARLFSPFAESRLPRLATPAGCPADSRVAFRALAGADEFAEGCAASHNKTRAWRMRGLHDAGRRADRRHRREA